MVMMGPMAIVDYDKGDSYLRTKWAGIIVLLVISMHDFTSLAPSLELLDQVNAIAIGH